jgi:hypothetical protein
LFIADIFPRSISAQLFHQTTPRARTDTSENPQTGG